MMMAPFLPLRDWVNSAGLLLLNRCLVLLLVKLLIRPMQLLLLLLDLGLIGAEFGRLFLGFPLRCLLSLFLLLLSFLLLNVLLLRINDRQQSVHQGRSFAGRDRGKIKLHAVQNTNATFRQLRLFRQFWGSYNDVT